MNILNPNLPYNASYRAPALSQKQEKSEKSGSLSLHELKRIVAEMLG